jgi:hypothetical protein
MKGTVLKVTFHKHKTEVLLHFILNNYSPSKYLRGFPVFFVECRLFFLFKFPPFFDQLTWLRLP